MLSGLKLSDYWAAYPALFPALFGLVMLLWAGYGRGREDRRWQHGSTVIFMALSAFLPAIMLMRLSDSAAAVQGMGVKGAMLVRADLLSLWLDVLFGIAGTLAVLILPRYLDRAGAHHPEVYPLTLFALSGMALMVGTENLMMVFIGLEVLSISLYVLCGAAREHSASIESALKYFLLGAFSTGFLVFGIALVMGATGHLDLPGIATTIHGGAAAGLKLGLLLPGIAMMLVGLTFKIGAVPFHFWLPDVYQGAPTPITAFMAAGTKAAALGVLIRVLHIGFSSGVPDDAVTHRWVGVVGMLAALTMVAGNLIALVQQRVKRMLAYSSIANAGYLLLGLIAPLEIGVANLVFYLLAYTFMTVGAFAIVSLFQDEAGEDADHIDNFKGLWKRRPLLAFAMLILLISMIGIPPTGGFTGKYLIFVAALDSGHTILAAIMAISAVIGAAYYLRIIVAMFVDAPQGDADPAGRRSLATAFVVAISVLMTLALGLAPAYLLDRLAIIHGSMLSLS